MNVCMHVYMFVCICVFMHACIHTYAYKHIQGTIAGRSRRDKSEFNGQAPRAKLAIDDISLE